MMFHSCDDTDAVDREVNNAIEAAGMQPVVVFSAYQAHGIDLDERILDERCIVECNGQRSQVLEGATWLQLCVEANRACLAANDLHHRFLESLDETDRQIDGVSVYELGMGS